MSQTMTPVRATLDDLMRTEGKAELIGGKVVKLMPTGYLSNILAGLIYFSLLQMVLRTRRGRVGSDGLGFTVDELPSGRQSFSPDVGYFSQATLENPVRFVNGAPDFAVEVRSENDYGPAAERAIIAKRADYFAAGTLVVWDVDPLAQEVRAYRPNAEPLTFTRGQVADAEPAVPDWSLDVNWLFEEAAR